ncbi:MAG: 2-oxo acid dehydrogenase subunit E2 [Deltaproteobacteria bacterium]|nr:2-oxo acid dehydrogenase subunit E2 [Deltaproteobacteria bacterium]
MTPEPNTSSAPSVRELILGSSVLPWYEAPVALAVVMPQLGESIVEATVVRFLVEKGQAVTRGQAIAEVETDKATNEVPAPADGTVDELLVPEGKTVPVGTEILRLATQDQTAPAPSEARAPRPAEAIEAMAPPSTRLPSAHLADRPRAHDGSFRGASPAVRRLSRTHDVDLSKLSGSGRNGRITRADVLAAIENGAKPAAQTAAPVELAKSSYRPPKHAPGPNDRVEPFSKRRSFIADHMVYSLATAAHVAAVVEIDMSRVARAKEADRSAAEKQGAKLTFTAYVVAAVARALEEHPRMNATVVDRSLVLRGDKNIGVAVDTPEGLIVPVLKHADRLNVVGIAHSLAALTEKARKGALTAEDLGGGTFTISNPGRDGNLFGISIIRQPEVGILRMGEVVKRPVVRELDGEEVIVIRPIMYAALSYDHRVIDGAVGNAFLHRVRALLESAEPS